MSVNINASTTNGLVLTSDTSGELKLQANGADIATVDSTGITMAAGKTLPAAALTGTLPAGTNVISAGTAVASTSGTSIDFTSIPSWVKRITVMLNGFSTNGTSDYLIQIGSGSVTTSGYLGGCYNSGGTNYTTGFGIRAGSAPAVNQGAISILLLNSNIYVASGVVSRSDAAVAASTGGQVTLSGTLDRVRITTVNGTDTFDAGLINILYE